MVERSVTLFGMDRLSAMAGDEWQQKQATLPKSPTAPRSLTCFNAPLGTTGVTIGRAHVRS